MFTQPSPEKIASTYVGNPAPLARKVDQDKKQNGGIPKDLRQLMALNDIAQGKNAAGIQQALQIPTNMPTVAQATQAQAQQALQARMMQMAREQQRLQQKPPVLPEGTPQPDDQPQGIDALSTNVGEGYAKGGIIGFNGTSSQFVQDLAALPQAFDEMKERARQEDAIKAAQDKRMEKYKQDKLAAQQKTSLFNYLFGSPEKEKEGQAEMEKLSAAPVSTAAEKPPATVATPLADIRSQLNAADAASRSQPGTPAPAPSPAKANVNAPAQTRVNTPEAPGIASALPPAQTEAYKKLTEMMNQDPELKAKALRDRYMKEVGTRDLSIFDKTAAELEARKQKLNAPKAGYDAMMEYLENVAMSGGRTSAEAGSRGAVRQRQQQMAREAEQNTLMDKILELGAKKSEAAFSEKKGMFDLTQKERDEVFKKAFDAAKSVNSSDDEAKRIAAQAVENEKNRQAQIRAAQIGAQDRDNLMSRAKALMAADPTQKMTLEEAMKRASIAAGATQMESTNVRDIKGYQDALEKINTRYQYADDKSEYGKRQLAKRDQEVAALNAIHGVSSQGLKGLPAAQAAPLPAKNQLVVGQIYQTARGPAKWNGTDFEQ